jgi:hypothetical protein
MLTDFHPTSPTFPEIGFADSFLEQPIRAGWSHCREDDFTVLSFSHRDLRCVGVVRSVDGLDLESAEPDLGVFDFESDLAAC